MQASARAQFDGLGEMKFSLRASSNGRFWTGFDAATYDVTRGIADRGPNAHYTIVMHVSAPVAGTARCDGSILHRIMRPGDIDLVPLGYAASWRDDAPGSVLNVKLSPSLVRSTAQAMDRVDLDALCIAPQLHVQDKRLEHLGWALVAELESGDQRDRLYAESIGSAIAAHLLRRYSSARPSIVPGRLSRRRLQDIVAYINENLCENLSLGELAAVAGVSLSHFKTLFKQTVGVPVHQYVIQRRVDLAVRLLSRAKLRLSEVAQQAGFADQSHMTRCIRRMTGLTPAAFVRLYR
jgi:AraC family transcriptional regulator